jgi:hypothetical protein
MPNLDRRTFARLSLAGLSLAALAPMALAQANTQPGSPYRIVFDIMKGYEAEKPPNLRNLPYTPAVKARVAKMEIDADFIVNGQDVQLTYLLINEEQIVSEKRRLVATTFKNIGEDRNVTFDFEEINGAWLIADIRHADGGTLRSMLNLPPRP